MLGVLRRNPLAVALAVALHLLLGLALLLSDWQDKPRPYGIKADVVQARVVDARQLEQEVKRLEQAQKREQTEREEALRKEQERLEQLKREQQQEKQRLAQLEQERKRQEQAEAQRKAEQEKQRKANEEDDARQMAQALEFLKGQGVDPAKGTVGASGVWVQVTKVGDGPKATTENRVTAHATGYLADGKKFWSSHDSGTPMTEHPVTRFVPGFTEGLQSMSAGGEAWFAIPGRLGYGQGHFDRAVAALSERHPVLTVGIAFSVQEIEAVPQEEHDRGLDWVVTEAEVIESTGRAPTPHPKVRA